MSFHAVSIDIPDGDRVLPGNVLSTLVSIFLWNSVQRLFHSYGVFHCVTHDQANVVVFFVEYSYQLIMSCCFPYTFISHFVLPSDIHYSSEASVVKGFQAFLFYFNENVYIYNKMLSYRRETALQGAL